MQIFYIDRSEERKNAVATTVFAPNIQILPEYLLTEYIHHITEIQDIKKED